MMKAFRLHKPGSMDGVWWEDIPLPPIGEHDVLVRIKSTALNYRDYAFIMGRYPLVKEPPLILGSDAAGVVERVGDKVTRFKSGDKVISLLRQRWYGGRLDAYKASIQLAASVDGVFAEYHSFNEQSLAKAPASLSLEEAATLPTAGLTAFRILTQSDIHPGDSVLIQGTGGVSIFALQIAKKLGLRVFATTGNKSNEELLKQLGADEIINYKEYPSWQERILSLTNNRGVDLVIDVVGGDSVQKSILAVAVNGKVALIGFLEDTKATIDLVSVIRRNIHLQAYTTGSREDLEQFVKFVDASDLKPLVAGVYSDFETAFSVFQSRKSPGKIIVTL